MTQFPWLATLTQNLPDSIVSFLNPSMESFNDFQKVSCSLLESSEVILFHDCRECKARSLAFLAVNFDNHKKSTSHATLFNTLLQLNLPPEELSETRLQQEAVGVVGAGLETTRWALSVASFYTLNNPQVLARLQEELTAAIPKISHPPSLRDLQKLPYLSACIEEGA